MKYNTMRGDDGMRPKEPPGWYGMVYTSLGDTLAARMVWYGMVWYGRMVRYGIHWLGWIGPTHRELGPPSLPPSFFLPIYGRIA